MRLKIFTTGGTIDKIYFDANSEFRVGDPQVVELLGESQVAFEYEVESLVRKDSLDLTFEDRQLIYDRITQDHADRFLITHGTDTMVETGRLLTGIEDKTIVLTGSLQPMRFRGSDGLFNLAYAVAAAQLLNAGVYIAMHGRIFDPATTRKNPSRQRFEDTASAT